jgi:hypothetical protein
VNEKRKQFCKTMEGKLSTEELEARRKNSAGLMVDLLEASNAESLVDTVLDRNDIEIGEDMDGKLDDTILCVFDEEKDEEKEESELAKATAIFTFETKAQIFVDEFSAVLAEELDDEFEDEPEREYMRLVFLGKLVSDLEEPSSGKMDMEVLRERCEFEMENNGNLLEIDGSRAADELARSLEKNGIITVKDDIVKWKR